MPGEAVLLGFFCFFLLLITAFRAHLLQPFNKLWMRFGLLLGAVVSPVVLGFIFFALFTPLGYCMRLSGRDELRIRQTDKQTYWSIDEHFATRLSFKQQF